MKERDIHTKLVSLPGTRQKVKKTEIQGNHKKKYISWLSGNSLNYL